MTGIIQQPCEPDDEIEDEIVEDVNEEYALVLSLLSHLECPVCYEVNEPPIYMCRNGHNVCHLCKIHMKECATCRTPGQPDIRNRFAERTYDSLTVPCGNADRGCAARTLPHRRDEHEMCCPHAPVGCAMCGFAGEHADLVEHVRQAHPEVEQIVMKSKTQTTRRVALQPFDRISTIIQDDAFFWFYERYEADANSFVFELLKSGPALARPSDHFAAVRFATDDLQDEVLFRYPIPCANEFSVAEERTISGNTLSLLAKEGTLRYVLCISHRDEEKERIASKINEVTSARLAEGDGEDTAFLFMIPLLFFLIVGCFKGWWQAVLSWHQ